ncbi:MAG: zinc ABC transporter substrate-binding protein [Candidatus Hydrogenedentes bacterium]|nr:zinc ABC transporter substrate-binding protein [Candidatus Hydrogenedentota bacterium]
MKRTGHSVRWKVLPAACAVAALASMACGCGGPGTGADKPLVYAGIPPHAYLVQRIAGDAVECRVLLPPGASPAMYDPTPAQMSDLGRAAVYVRSGVPFEEAIWDKIRDANRAMRVVDTQAGVALRAMESHEHEGENHGGHEGGRPDPHVWLVPGNAAIAAKAVCEALQAVDPEHSTQYAENLDGLLAELDALDAELASILKPLQGKEFWVFHPAWGYFADAYGLKQRSIEAEGKEPGPQSMGRLVDEMKAEGVRVVFYDPQFSARQAEVLAKEVGAEVQELNPMAEDYAENLRAAARAIAGAAS